MPPRSTPCGTRRARAESAAAAGGLVEHYCSFAWVVHEQRLMVLLLAALAAAVGLVWMEAGARSLINRRSSYAHGPFAEGSGHAIQPPRLNCPTTSLAFLFARVRSAALCVPVWTFAAAAAR